MRNEIERKILKLLSNGKSYSEYQIAKEVGVSWNTTKKILNDLALDGELIKREKVMSSTGNTYKLMWSKKEVV